jgi:Tfp pilus assembly protein FimT
MNRRGFTILELIIGIIVVIALAVFASAAVFKVISSFRFSAAVNTTINHIRYAQQQARTHNGWYGVRFEPNPTNRYTVYSTNGTTDAALTNPANPSSNLVINLQSEYNVLVVSANIGGGNQVEFNPRGVPYLDKNTSALSTTGTITLSSDGKSKIIQIFPTTGRVELQ